MSANPGSFDDAGESTGVDRDPPDVCPDCGAVDAYERRYETGGGWRAVFRCVNCGRRHRSTVGGR